MSKNYEIEFRLLQDLYERLKETNIYSLTDEEYLKLRHYDESNYHIKVGEWTKENSEKIKMAFRDRDRILDARNKAIYDYITKYCQTNNCTEYEEYLNNMIAFIRGIKREIEWKALGV